VPFSVQLAPLGTRKLSTVTAPSVLVQVTSSARLTRVNASNANPANKALIAIVLICRIVQSLHFVCSHLRHMHIG
jgi:hypothetical protein